MKKNKKIILVAVIILVLTVVVIIVSQQKVPTSGKIFDEADRCWRAKEFSRLTNYMDIINKAYSNYVPVIVLDAIYTEHYKVEYEQSIEIQKYLHKCIEKNYVYIPYVFKELLQGKLNRSIDHLEHLNKYLLRNNISKEEYLKRLSPENQNLGKTIASMHELLFFNIPKVFITTNSIEYLNLPMSLKNNFALILESEEELKKIVFDYEESMVKREKARNKLVVKRYQKGGITNLFQGFSTIEAGYMSLSTAQKLYLIGEDSLPYIVEFLNSDKVRDGDIVLWAIMMMQYNGLSKDKALEYVNQIDEYYFEKSEYARRIRKFLQNSE